MDIGAARYQLFELDFLEGLDICKILKIYFRERMKRTNYTHI